MEQVENIKKFNPINFIKTIATLCVFLLHASIFAGLYYGFSYSDKTWFFQTPAWAAVWIFFFLSGYFNGVSFLGNPAKYDLSTKGILQFYYRRFVKIILPTWFFILLCVVFCEPELIANSPCVLLKVLFLRYAAVPNSNTIGATWYVFTLAHLYIVTPFLCFFVKKICKRISFSKGTCILRFLLFCSICAGLLLRITIYKEGGDWSGEVYVPFYCNLDIYFSGILMSKLVRQKEYNRCKYNRNLLCSVILFLAVILINTRVYYRGNTNSLMIWSYQFVFPSVYIIVMSVIVELIMGWNVIYKPQKNGICRFLDFFSSISFEFYLLHSAVLFKIAPFIGGGSATKSYILLVGSAFVLTLVFAYAYKNGYMNNRKVNGKK